MSPFILKDEMHLPQQLTSIFSISCLRQLFINSNIIYCNFSLKCSSSWLLISMTTSPHSSHCRATLRIEWAATTANLVQVFKHELLNTTHTVTHTVHVKHHRPLLLTPHHTTPDYITPNSILLRKDFTSRNTTQDTDIYAFYRLKYSITKQTM